MGRKCSYKKSQPTPSYPLPPVRIPLPSKRAPPAGNQVFKHISLKNTFHTQTTTVSFWTMFKFHTGLSDWLDRILTSFLSDLPCCYAPPSAFLHPGCQKHDKLNLPYFMRLTDEERTIILRTRHQRPRSWHSPVSLRIHWTI